MEEFWKCLLCEQHRVRGRSQGRCGTLLTTTPTVVQISLWIATMRNTITIFCLFSGRSCVPYPLLFLNLISSRGEYPKKQA